MTLLKNVRTVDIYRKVSSMEVECEDYEEFIDIVLDEKSVNVWSLTRSAIKSNRRTQYTLGLWLNFLRDSERFKERIKEDDLPF